MNYLRMITVATLFFCMASSAAAGKDDGSPKQFISNWASAFEKDDHKPLLDFYDQSEEVEMIVSAGTRIQGYREIQKSMKNDFNGVKFSDSEIEKVTVRKLGDTALIAFEHKFKLEFKENKTRWQAHIQTTSVLNRKGGVWKIVLEHSSPIKGIDRYVQIHDDIAPLPE